ncbi:MAG: HAD family hydrolase [Anaerolineales bacterium]
MPLNVLKIKALCFDVDGTLSDSDNVYTQKLSRYIPKFLFKKPDEAARRLVMWMESPGNALLSFADTLHRDGQMVALIDWLSQHRQRSDKEFLLIHGVDDMLKQLHGHYPMAVVSARDEKTTLRFLEKFDLAKYFDVIVTGLSAKYTKPYPDPIFLAAKKMNVAPENCLMIGDTTVDIRAGKSAGAQTVGVLCGFGEEPELRKMGADEILEDTTKLLKILN